ncbi:MAG: type II toxin-antitoxin system VapC family toxin [Acidobacteria bacterium]|nr:MAG: type II toxin-antitoxin system VapC family toxin [Acidobacteriota bacterium]RLE31126.1 MAG: type II toxin-antitoxin system VapC family toxin [Acidobacteriota bacterium]
MIIADTDVLVDFLRDRKPMADRIALELTSSSFVTTVITQFELLSGIRTRREATAVEALLDVLDVFSLDPAAARRAAEVRRTLESKGQAIGMADSLIAGICLERNGILLTRNMKHFSRVDDLTLSGRS